ncbi:hypothetical protein L1987_58545 [Smallanthus sonchifolius]|uniref:Uncharacterized protein n=1 Tax=Smallanthus sonchifolius TaxID=185202 RepID=A0ACB9DFI6_9ASTR|nr:hypothetical protein L1987_58545 [Smallanthus sonchifolius]
MGRFWRMAEEFEVAGKVRDCDSSGSEHSPETMMDLSDLVNSFIENGNGVVNRDFDMEVDDECILDGSDDDMKEMKESLKRLVRIEDGDDVGRKLILNVQEARRDVIRDNSPPSSQSLGFKRQVMVRLRDQGLDAGFCKSKWEKKGRLLAGDHEYIDVNVAKTRYIVIISLFEDFEIARPTNNYASLLEILPKILVSKVEDFKEIVKIMSRAMKKSMNQMKMTVPPWRRHEYVQAKWFGAYKRTTNEFPTKKTQDSKVINKKSIGFISIPVTCYGRRRDEFVRKDFGYKMGNLAVVMNGAS